MRERRSYIYLYLTGTAAAVRSLIHDSAVDEPAAAAAARGADEWEKSF